MKINENQTSKISVTLNVRNLIVDETGFASYEVYQHDNPDFIMSFKRVQSEVMFNSTCLSIKSTNDVTSLIRRPVAYYVISNGMQEVNKLIIDLFGKLGFKFHDMVNDGIKDGSTIKKGATIAAWESDRTIYTNTPQGPDKDDYTVIELTVENLIHLVEDELNESEQ